MVSYLNKWLHCKKLILFNLRYNIIVMIAIINCKILK